jgi:hypothetical protein
MIGIKRPVELYQLGTLELDLLVRDTVPVDDFQALTDRLLGGEILEASSPFGPRAIEQTAQSHGRSDH